VQIHLPDLAATFNLGAHLGNHLPAGSVLLLQGDLGSGKTTLVQGLGASLGITDAIVSPTFTLVNEYPEARLPLYHLDLYRLDPCEVGALHPEHYWQGQEFPLGIVAVEWPERLWELAELLGAPGAFCPSTYLQLEFSRYGDGRKVNLTAVGDIALTDLSLAESFSD
jgi:tRNA threonylcarbamoyladenosine biosynthesis protein TsaE